MTRYEAKRAPVGARVMWQPTRELGTIVAKGDAYFSVRWDVGPGERVSFVHYLDASDYLLPAGARGSRATR